MAKIFFVLVLLTGLFPALTQAAEAFKTEKVAEVSGVPWGLAQLDDNTLIYTLREGKIGLLNIKEGSSKSLDGFPEIAAYGQGGMLDVAVRPGYAEGDWIYFTYSKMHKGFPETTLARAILDGTKLSKWQDLLISKAESKSGNHFGSRIAFDDESHVYFGVGDRGERDYAQDLSNHAGTIIRLNIDGSVPEDNPFV